MTPVSCKSLKPLLCRCGTSGGREQDQIGYMGTAASQWSVCCFSNLYPINSRDQSVRLEIAGYHVEYENNGKELDCDIYKLP
jgi:hypothetical protein